MNMFSNYECTPSSYIPNNLIDEKLNLEITKKPLEVYDRNYNLIGYSWYFGDQIVLEFTTIGNVVFDDGHYEDAETYLHGKKLELQFLDFRYNIVYDVIQDASATAKFYITNTDVKTFVRGTYRCKLTLIDDSDKDHPQKYTLMDVDEYTFSIM